MKRSRHLKATNRWPTLALALLLYGCAPKQPVDLLIDNVAILNVETGSYKTGQVVTVVDGLIAGIEPAAHASQFKARQTIDGEGGFLLPALGDAHVHLRYTSELAHFTLFGVGLVVNMSGDPSHLRLREEVRSGALSRTSFKADLRTSPGPRIVTAGPTLDGSPPTNPLFAEVTPETAANIVEWIAAEGYDLVKVYQQMPAETLRAVVQAANNNGLLTAGHVSRSAGVGGTLEAGMRYVAHGEELIFEAFEPETLTFDHSQIEDIVTKLEAAGATVTPMIRFLEDIPAQALDLDVYLMRDEFTRLPAAMRVMFGPRQGWFSGREDPEAFARQMTNAAQFVSAVTAELNRQGVPLLLGTDAGFGGALPGLGVHLELQSLVSAGLSELEALQTATLRLGKYLQQIDPTQPPWGQVRPGFSADLLLLAADPLEDISSTLSIRGVAQNGVWTNTDQLQSIDSELSDRQAVLLPIAQAFEDAVATGDLAAAEAALAGRPAPHDEEALMAPDSCIFLGYRHYYGGGRELAGSLYELCAQMHPDSAPLWWHIGRAKESAGDVEGALAAYRRAETANPWFRQPGEAIRGLESQ